MSNLFNLHSAVPRPRNKMFVFDCRRELFDCRQGIPKVNCQSVGNLIESRCIVHVNVVCNLKALNQARFDFRGNRNQITTF